MLHSWKNNVTEATIVEIIVWNYFKYKIMMNVDT